MTFRVAVLGWGSLLWDPDGLEAAVETGPDGQPLWAMGAGPRLPLEFSRVSAKRLGALALVIDPADGALCETHAATHRGGSDDLEAAVAAAASDLARRERAPEARIGRAPAPDLPARKCAAEIAAWLETSAWDGAVWTDLPVNFREQTGQDFTPPAGAAHLKTLRGASWDSAVDYIARAPAAVRTPLRAALEADPEWRAAVAARRPHWR